MTDKELLKKAAMACGVDLQWNEAGMPTIPNNYGRVMWNPLTNLGDCAEMNAVLRLATIWNDENEKVAVFPAGPHFADAYFKDHNNDPLAAWMYASTVVAGMMGERE